MSAIPDTPGGPGVRNNYEFTPIGYAKAPGITEMTEVTAETRKRLSEEQSDIEDSKPPQKARRPDDTLNSIRIFNDSSFDDTLPSQSRIPEFKKNLVADLVGSELANQNGTASNPLKEQQESLHKLNMENYNLRVKCNSLMKFLNNVTDDGELKKNLEILDELHDWKTKYQSLNKAFLNLQKQFDESEDKEAGSADQKKIRDHEKRTADLEGKVADYELDLSKSKSQLVDLENKIARLKDESMHREKQRNGRIEALKMEISDLRSSLSTKDRDLEETYKKIERLSNQLLEYDHQGGSLLELEKQIDLKNEGIKNLETRLQESNHMRQALERQLASKTTEFDSLKHEFENYRQESKEKLDELMKKSAFSDNEAKGELSSLFSQQKILKDRADNVSKKNEELQIEINNRDHQIRDLRENIKKLRDEYAHDQAAVNANVAEGGNVLKEKLKRANEKLQQMTASQLSLEKENEGLKKQIVNQISKSPNLKQNSKRLLEKEKEIKLLRTTIQDLENDLARYRRDLNDLKRENVKKVTELEVRLQNSETEPLLQRKRLEKEVSILKLELDSTKETKNREIAILENKCNALKAENVQLQHQDDNHSNHLQKQLLEKHQELNDLAQRCSDLTMEKLRLSRELSQIKDTGEKYKEELKMTSSRLEYITKEFVKMKESAGKQSPTSGSNLTDKWAEKYQNMKQKLLNELKMLQDENLSLERRLLEKGASFKAASTTVESTPLQDEVDYYKLRYNREVKQNNDLKVMNEYLNRVLRAGSQHLRLDILKLENEVPDETGVYHTYPPRLRFKTVALFVLVCIRCKRTALKHRWDDQRLTYLQRKIVMDQEKMTW